MRLQQRRAAFVHLEVDAEPRRDDAPVEDLVDRLGLRPGRIAVGVEEILRDEVGLAVVVADAEIDRGASDLVRIVGKDADRLESSALSEWQLRVAVRRDGAVGVDVVVPAVGVFAEAAVVLHPELEVVAPAHELVGVLRHLARERGLGALPVVPRVDAAGDLAGVEVVESPRDARTAIERVAVIHAVEARVARFQHGGRVDHRGPQHTRRRVVPVFHAKGAGRGGGGGASPGCDRSRRASEPESGFFRSAGS